MKTSRADGHLERRQLLAAAGAAAVCVSCSVGAEQVAEQVIGEAVGDATVVGFGQPINLGPAADVFAAIRENNGFWYRPDGRMWVTEYPADSLPRARNVYSPPELVGMEAGFVALNQKCTHLGCRVPSCTTSQWFECPCHAAKFNRVGEARGGPVQRGMDRYAIEITNRGDVIVHIDELIQGPPLGTNTTGQEAAGPHCIGDGSH